MKRRSVKGEKQLSDGGDFGNEGDRIQVSGKGT